MNNNISVWKELQRYYALWKAGSALYEKWSNEHGLSSNGVYVLYAFYENDGTCTQKMISENWCIPKQTVNTILKDFQRKGYVEMVSMPEDKRNKLVHLTETGKILADDIIGKLQKKEIYVIEKMGLDNIKNMNDNIELFVRLFGEGGLDENES